MADIATTTGFTEDAMKRLSGKDGDGFLPGLRDLAFERFVAMPTPSPETEEWRYTDLRAFDLSAFRPFAGEPEARNLDQIRPEVLAAAGEVGDRAGLAVQHNSTMVSAHLDPSEAAKGVTFASIDEAVRTHAGILRERLHHAVPAARTKFTALHAAFRTGGTFVHVPRGVRVELPLQALTYVDRDGLAVFPHTVLVTEEGAELTFIDRYVSPDLGRALSDAVVEIYAGPGSKITYVALQEWGQGVTHLSVQRAVLGRDAEVRSLGVAFGASLSRAEVESDLAEAGGSSEPPGKSQGMP